MGRKLCIDWDLYFDDFIKIAIPYTNSLIQFLRDKTGLEIKGYYQMSANGNVHIGLKFKDPITVLDAFLIRGWMTDDTKRLRMDLARYLKTGSLHEINRCFSDKIEIKNGQVTLMKAGEWIRLDPDPELPSISTSEAHALISKMQRECLERKKEVKTE